jgi:hypothetical protein
VDILVLYGFHPEEPLAEEIGKNLSERYLQDVETIRFRPSYIPDNVHHLPEAIAISLAGYKERRNFIKENYHARFILDLHETPLDVCLCDPRFAIHYPGANVRLGGVLNQFTKTYSENIDLIGRRPIEHYHSATVEFYSKAKNKQGLMLTKLEGERFVLNFIDYLKTNYLQEI